MVHVMLPRKPVPAQMRLGMPLNRSLRAPHQCLQTTHSPRLSKRRKRACRRVCTVRIKPGRTVCLSMLGVLLHGAGSGSKRASRRIWDETAI